MRRCIGCGRPLGLRGTIECPCWTAVNRGARIPTRIKRMRKRVLDVREIAAAAKTLDQWVAARKAVERVNLDLPRIS